MQQWVTWADSIQNLGALVRYSYSEAHLGYLKLSAQDNLDSTLLPRLILNYSVPLTEESQHD